MRKMFSGISGLFKNRKYMCYVLQFGFAQGALFANISSAPFIMQGHYGFSPMLFSVCFGINALAIVIFAALSVKFRTMEKALMTGSVWMLVFSAFLCAVLCLDGGFWAYETMLVGLLASLGLTFTASNTLAMDAGRECAGTASALLGAAGFIFGGAVSVLAGIGNVMVSAGILFFVCSACALVCTLTAGENPRFYLKKAFLSGGNEFAEGVEGGCSETLRIAEAVIVEIEFHRFRSFCRTYSDPYKPHRLVLRSASRTCYA